DDRKHETIFVEPQIPPFEYPKTEIKNKGKYVLDRVPKKWKQKTELGHMLLQVVLAKLRYQAFAEWSQSRYVTPSLAAAFYRMASRKQGKDLDEYGQV